MKTIYKYPLGIGRNELQLPEGSEFLHVGVQKGDIYVWVLLDAANPSATYSMYVAGTGWNLHEDIAVAEYIGTVELQDDMSGEVFMWHAFDVTGLLV